MITELDTRTFDKTLQETSDIALVDFWAPWCGPCRVQLPILEQLASETQSGYRVYKVNVDDNEQLAVRFGIASIPTLLLFRNGELVKRFTGLQQESVLREALSALCGSSSQVGAQHAATHAFAKAGS